LIVQFGSAIHLRINWRTTNIERSPLTLTLSP
jgi:hypothetical protein